MRIVFLGSSAFALPALQALAGERKHELALVVTQPDKPKGRSGKPVPTPVGELAAKLGIRILKPENINKSEIRDKLAETNPDILVTASFGAIIGKKIRELAPFGAINIHPSLLPRYRGASPIQSALLAGDKETGISIFRLEARLDAGPILLQERLKILPKENHTALEQRLAISSAALLKKYLAEPDSYPTRPQSESLASYCGKIEKKDLLIDWSQPAEAIHNRIRAFSLEPGAITYLEGQSLKILETRILDPLATPRPGFFREVYKNQGFSIDTLDNELLVTLLQPAGRKAMSAWAFQLGARLVPKQRFGGIKP